MFEQVEPESPLKLRRMDAPSFPGERMSYREFERPAFGREKGQTVQRWMRWLEDERVLHNPAPKLDETCQLCLGPVGRRDDGQAWSNCYTCYRNGYILDAFVPITYSIDSGLESMLHRYKDRLGYRWLGVPLGALLVDFWESHGQHIADLMGGLDVIVPIPPNDSSRQFDHLRGIVDIAPDYHRQLPWSWGSLTRNLNVPRPKRNEVNSAAYEISPDVVKGKRVVLFDDLWTSGASMLSSAQKLQNEGAEAIVGVTLGRQLNVTHDYCNNLELVPIVTGRSGGGGCILCTIGI